MPTTKTLLTLLLFLLIGNSTVEAQTPLQEIMLQYRADEGSISRFYFVENSPERRERISTLVADYQQRLGKIDFSTLDVGARADYLLFSRDLKEENYQSKLEETEYNQIKSWIPFAEEIYAIEKSRRRGTVLDAQKLASQFTKISKQIPELSNRLKEDISLTKPLAMRAEGAVKGLRTALKSVNEFYNGYDPLFTWWMPSPYAKLDSLLGNYAALFHNSGKGSSTQKKDESGIVGNLIGRDELNRRLQLEMIPYTPEELVEIANKEFAWCDAEMLKASQEMGLGNDWKKALEILKNTAVPPAQQPAEMVKLYDQSLDFIAKNKLITLPAIATETWRMIMMTPERQKVNPFFTGGEEFSVSYPTNTMTQEQKIMSMRGNNPHFSRATVQHELFPGHALQEFMTDRYNTHRHIRNPFWL